MSKRMMHINLFIFGCGHHRAAWRHPDSAVERLGDIAYYEQLAQVAVRGKLDAIFFADGHSTDNLTDGPRWFLEPLTALSAISRATRRSEEHTSELQSLMRISYAVFCLKKKTNKKVITKL